MRFNHLQPPFNNPKARQAAMYALAQEDLLRAQYGEPEIYKLCNAPFICGAPYGKEYGDFLIKPNLEKARALLKESGYDGTPITMLHQTDLASSNQFQPVAKQQLERAGFKVNVLAMDWQTVISRAPARSRRRRAAGTSSSPPTSRSTSTIPAPATSPPRPATRPGSAGRAIRRSRRCAPPSSRKVIRPSARRSASPSPIA